MKYLSIFIRVALLALGQSSDCHSASEVSLMDMGKSVNVCMTTTKHSKAKTVCIFLGIYCNHMPSKVWDEITYPFSNVNDCTTEALKSEVWHEYVWSKVNIWIVNCVWANALIFDTGTEVLAKCQSFWDRKCLDMRGTRTPQPSDPCQMPKSEHE